jgi:hypothetical protein
MTESKRRDDDVATEPKRVEPDTEPQVLDSREPRTAEAPPESSSAEDGAAGVEAEARPKKKSKPRRSEADADELATRPLNAQGRERPLFLTQFPEDAELARLVAAFEAGNYALIRSDAEGVAERASDPRVREAALELRRRIDPDPLIKYLLGLAVALFLFLVLYSYHLH